MDGISDNPDHDGALQSVRTAVDALPMNHPARAGNLYNLGIELVKKYQETEELDDVDSAIQIFQEAVDMTPDDNPDVVLYLDKLAGCFGDKYGSSYFLPDLDRSICIAEKIMNKISQDHPQRLRHLSNLANAKFEKYMVTGESLDLDASITADQNTIELMPPEHPELLDLLSRQGLQYGERFRGTRDLADVKNAISNFEKVVGMADEDNPDRADFLFNLAVQLSEQYGVTGAMSDLEAAVKFGRLTLGALLQQGTSPGGEQRLDNVPNYLMYLESFASLLSTWSTKTRNQADVDEAICYLDKVIEIIPDDHPKQATYPDELALQLGRRHAITGKLTDAEDALLRAQQALEKTDDDSDKRGGMLGNLGIRFGDRYKVTGDLADLESALEFIQQASVMLSDDSQEKAKAFSTLGILLGERYTRIGALIDLEDSVQMERHAVSLTPDDHPNKGGYLNNLGLQLSDRYARLNKLDDLEESISAFRKGTELPFPTTTDKARCFGNLGVNLGHRYTQTKNEDDLGEAIRFAQQAVQLSPFDTLDRSGQLINLSLRFDDKYAQTGDISDLDKAIEASKDAIHTMSVEQLERAAWMASLGERLFDRYSKMNSSEDLSAGMDYHRSALMQNNGAISARIGAGRELVQALAQRSEWQDAFKIGQIVIPMLPRLMARPLQTADKQHILGQLAGFASTASAVALHADEGPLVALEILEQGRGLLATSLDEMRVDTLRLKERHPDLAQSFQEIRAEISKQLVRSPLALTPMSDSPRFTDGNRRFQLEVALDNLVDEIQQKPGFDDFLSVPKAGQMRNAASEGPIVVINMSHLRCDAIIVEAHQVRLRPLPGLKNEEAIEISRTKRLGSPFVLEWLWDVAAGPVIEALGLSSTGPDGNWPHIWWIPTGVLSRFPLHAAGNHRHDRFETVMSRAMSSYSPSIKALIQGRQQPTHSPRNGDHPKVVLVAMKDTPDASRLKYAPDEVQALRQILKSTPLTLLEPPRHKKDILSHMPSCTIFHFAGHDSQIDMTLPGADYS